MNTYLVVVWYEGFDGMSSAMPLTHTSFFEAKNEECAEVMALNETKNLCKPWGGIRVVKTLFLKKA